MRAAPSTTKISSLYLVKMCVGNESIDTLYDTLLEIFGHLNQNYFSFSALVSLSHFL